jgi:hypothetical protein
MVNAKPKTGEPELPAGYMAVMKAMVATLTQQGYVHKPGQNKSGGTPQGAGGGDGKQDHSQVTCYKCKKKGHLSRHCPGKKTGDGGSTKGGDSKDPPPNEWKYTLPTGANAATATLEKGDRKYRWCSTCHNGKGMFMYHHADTHDAWALRQKERNGDGGKSANKASLATTFGVDSDDFINFGVLNGSM